MDQLLAGFFDEIEKIAVSHRLSSFRKGRGGRRPIRVHNLLKKETAFLPSRSPLKRTEVVIDDSKDPQDRTRRSLPQGINNRGEAEVEGGRGMQEAG